MVIRVGYKIDSVLYGNFKNKSKYCEVLLKNVYFDVYSFLMCKFMFCQLFFMIIFSNLNVGNYRLMEIFEVG